MRAYVPLLVALGACGPEDPQNIRPEPTWTDADRIGTTPDFYDAVPRNLLMISIDTLRKDHVDPWSGRQLMPFLGELAERGFTLDDHTQCSNWTYASVVCTLRGAYNVDAGFVPKLSVPFGEPVPPGTEFLASWLGEAGFYPILVSGNTWFGPRWGTTPGYLEVALPPSGSAETLFAAGLERLLAARARGEADRWYLHLHLMEPHAPYAPPDAWLHGLEALDPVPWDLTDKDEHYDANVDWANLSDDERALLEQHLRVRYEGELGFLDDQLASIFGQLGRHGLLDDTLVVIWNDHGEQFWEHGYQSHAYTLHAEENDAWAVFWSRNIVPGRWTGPTSSVDLVPTLLSLWDLELPDGVTGLPLGSAPPDRPRFATSMARLGVVQMVRQGAHKLLYSWDGYAKLFDTEADPREQDDLFDPEHPQAQALWSLLEPYAERAEPLAPEHLRIDPPGL